MSHGNDSFRTLPGRSALQIHHAVLRDQKMYVGAGVGHDTAGLQRWADASVEIAGLVLHGGGTTDETLSSLGAQYKVQLAAGAAVCDSSGKERHVRPS